MDRLKSFLRRYGVELLEGYLAAMVCFLCMYTAGFNIWMTAVMIGMANTYLKIPVVNALQLGNADSGDIFAIRKKIVFKNIGEALMICSLIFLLFYIVDTYFFTTVVEPISFGILYEGLHIIGVKSIKKLRTS